jgi:DNA-binding IclR family transcriptional regulator
MGTNTDILIPNEIKKSHPAKVLAFYILAQEGPYTIAEVVERTGMRVSTASTVLLEMEDTGYVKEIKDSGDTKYRIVKKSVIV